MAYVNETGYPSVTELIGPYIDKTWFTPEHSARGEAVHAACEAHINGLFVMPLRADYQPYFDSFRRWADKAIDDVILTEERLVDESLGFCGKPDAVLRIKGDDCLALADWKTSQAYQRWWSVQAAGYEHLIRIEKGIEMGRAISVRLKADGSGCLIDEHEPGGWNIFLGLLNSYNFFNRK